MTVEARSRRLVLVLLAALLPVLAAQSAGAVDVVTKASPASVAAGTAQKILWISGNGFEAGATVLISGDGISEIAAPVVVQEEARMDGGTGDGIRYTIGIAENATSGRRDITVTGFDGSMATGVGILEITGGGAAPPTGPPVVGPDMGAAPPTNPGTLPPDNLPPESTGVDVITRASPIHGSQGDQVNLWIVGRTFTDGVNVAFSAPGMGPALVEGLPLPLKVVRNIPSEAEKLDGIEFYLRINPETPLGPVNITVTGPDGTSATGLSAFTVLAPGALPPPVAGAGNADVITGASPAAIRAGRNVSLWIWGRDYEPGANVIFSQTGIRTYSPYQVVNDAGNFPGSDGIRAFLLVDTNVPIGPVDVTVVNPNGSQVIRPALVQIVDQGGEAGAGGASGAPVEPCLPVTSSVEDIIAVRPTEVLRGTPLPLTITGHGFACGATVVLAGGGLEAPPGSAPRIVRDAVDPTLTTLQWDLLVSENAEFGPRNITVVNPNLSKMSVEEAFYVVEELSGDGGDGGGKAGGISACQAAPGGRWAPAALLLFVASLGGTIRRRRR